MLPTLCEGDFVEQGENLLAFGLPGRGKTHIACAIGHELIQRGRRVLFTPTFALVQRLPYFIGGRDPGFREDAPVYETTTTYDVLGRKVRTVEPNGGVYELTYDLARAARDPFLRRRATVVDPLRKTRVMYRRLDDKISAVEEHLDSLVHTTRYQYDPMGDLRAVIDAKGNETRVEYDRLGRRKQLVSPDAGTTDFAYDDMGNLVSRQDGNLVQAAKEGKLPADQAFVFFEYDLDQLIAVNKPLGTDVKYEYGRPGAPENGAGRIVRVVDDAGSEARGYGKLGETIRSTRTVKPLKPNDSPQTFETRFEFDSFGRMLRLWYPDGEVLTYGYDAAGLVNRAEGHRPATKHWEEATEVYLGSLTYDEFGARRHAVLGNGATTTWTYEPDTQRLKHVDTASQGRVLQALTYTYDLVGNVKTLTNALGEATGRRSGAVSYTYDYDDLYRLTTATGTALSRPGVVDWFKTTYAFDEIHNMTRLDQKHWLTTANDPDNETAHPPHTNHDFDYAYGGAGPHQATKIGDRNLVHDANGNTLRECRDHGDANCQANSDKLRRYFWGEENELNAVIDGGGWNITRFIYDAGGQRVVKLGRGGESITIGQFFALKGRKAATKHVFIGEVRVASKLLPSPGWEPSWSEGTAVSGPILAGTAVETVNGCDPSTYQPQKCPIDPAANPVIDRRPDTTKIKPATYYYHSDHLGSTSWVTDQNGRVHEHVEYFPYGEVWRDARYDSDGDPVHRQQFLFSAKEMDEETGLYYSGARYLDPVRATWVSTDPILDQYVSGSGNGGVFHSANLALYSYSHNRPSVLRDPDGRIVETAWDAANVAIGAYSLVSNVREGKWGWAALDAVGLVYDSAATLVPFLPAGVGAANKALRAGAKVTKAAEVMMDTARAADKAHDIAREADLAAHAAQEGTRIHQKVGKALEEADALSDSARNFFGGANKASGKMPDLSWGDAPGVWLDLTTKGQWTKHVSKYGAKFGEGIPLLYERGKGLVNTTRLVAGAGAVTSGTQWLVEAGADQAQASQEGGVCR